VSALLKLFGGNYQLYFVALLLAALGVSSSAAFFERGQAIEYQGRVGALNTQLKGAKGALAINAAAVTSLEGALDEWKDKADSAAAREGEALKHLDEQTVIAADTKLKLQTTERADNALPDCAKLLSMDLGLVCPGHVAALRVRAANPSGLPGPHRQGAGPDAHPP
jgi:uncharacterized protein HemX